MGNTVNIEQKGDRGREVTDKMIKELKDQVRLVDDTMCGLAKTLDSLEAACELFLKQVDDRSKTLDESQDKRGEKSQDVEELAAYLLKILDESLCSQKRSALQSLTKLIQTGRGFFDGSEENFQELSLEKYITDQEQRGKMKEILPYYEVRVENLRKELTMAAHLDKQCRDDIAILEDKDRLNRKEISILRERLTGMEKQIEDLEAENELKENEKENLSQKLKKMNNGNELLRKSINVSEKESKDISQPYKEFGHERRVISPREDTKNEIQMLKNDLENAKTEKECLEAELRRLKTKQCIHVQTMDKASSVKPINELLSLIKGKIDTESSQLYVSKVSVAADMKADIPLLLFCYASQVLQYIAKKALDDVKVLGLHRVALVIVHRETDPSYIRDSNNVLSENMFKELCGIFDIGYTLNAGIYECDINKRNVAGIVEFVQRKGVRISTLETYGIC